MEQTEYYPDDIDNIFCLHISFQLSLHETKIQIHLNENFSALLKIICMWHHGSHIGGPEQRKSGHLGGLSLGDMNSNLQILFFLQSFLFSPQIRMTIMHMSDNQLKFSFYKGKMVMNISISAELIQILKLNIHDIQLWNIHLK